ncbi:hypothetical protein BCR32DRAFT_297345 [Anaeromyces robustus]|uniref:Ankyrin n=1 Tax=Anaeromyces robustus TaxID=1754192 RepID=A0A1Y1WCZ0_9FUNG|nr:hypothetical protein BCR32DRAFT_297345 [Anaeromyces robustus]|eukprot:ORX71014.1 hypothetical protein BCR32DRAFT_297345 [Anaeromyces robustus]
MYFTLTIQSNFIIFIDCNAQKNIIEFIIEQQEDKENIKPLFYAIQLKNFRIANLLLKNKANIDGIIRSEDEDEEEEKKKKKMENIEEDREMILKFKFKILRLLQQQQQQYLLL